MVAAVIVASLAIAFIGLKIADASAPSGLASSQQYATTTQVGPQYDQTVAAANPNCAARIIGTQAQPIMLIFADPTNGDISSSTISQSVGFIQAASTTVSYDSGIYGCGRVIGYAAASTTITVAETK